MIIDAETDISLGDTRDCPGIFRNCRRTLRNYMIFALSLMLANEGSTSRATLRMEWPRLGCGADPVKFMYPRSLFE